MCIRDSYNPMYIDEEMVDDGPGVIFDTDGYFTKDEAVANSPYGAHIQTQMERYGRENPRLINRTETAVLNDGSTIPVSNAVSLRDYEGNQASMNGEIINRADALNYDRCVSSNIFTNQNNTLGWIEFYREKFNNFNII